MLQKKDEFQQFWDKSTESVQKDIVKELVKLKEGVSNGLVGIVKYSCGVSELPIGLQQIVLKEYTANREKVLGMMEKAEMPLFGSKFNELTEEEQNTNIRMFYALLANEVASSTLPKLKLKDLKEFEIAQITSAMRTCAAADSRGMMTNPVSVRNILAREMSLYGHPAGATYKQLKIKKSDAEIIESSSKVNEDVNKKFGVKVETKVI